MSPGTLFAHLTATVYGAGILINLPAVKLNPLPKQTSSVLTGGATLRSQWALLCRCPPRTAKPSPDRGTALGSHHSGSSTAVLAHQQRFASSLPCQARRAQEHKRVLHPGARGCWCCPCAGENGAEPQAHSPVRARLCRAGQQRPGKEQRQRGGRGHGHSGHGKGRGSRHPRAAGGSGCAGHMGCARGWAACAGGDRSAAHPAETPRGLAHSR